MELKEFVEKFAEQFDETDASEIHAETAYHELEEWSSLVAMSVIAFIKLNYNKEITGKDLRECNTVLDLFNLVSSK